MNPLKQDIIIAVVTAIIASLTTLIIALRKSKTDAISLNAEATRANAEAIKTNAEAVNQELHNVIDAVELWRKTAADFAVKCRELIDEIEILRKENQELKRQILHLQHQISRFSKSKKTDPNL